MKKILPLITTLLLLLTACDLPDTSADFSAGSGVPLKIVSGSENKELEPILKQYAEKHDINLQIDYKGSLDIMKMLTQPVDKIEYDAVWPASSIWTTLGDKNHVLKHQENTSYSPVVFGIKKSKAKALGFIDKDVSMKDIRKAVADKKLTFAMTSATQSNSGASAYLSFLSSLTKDGDITQSDLEDPALKKEITSLLSGVNRTSGSSGWLVDLFLQKDYDAMVNYETLIIQANKKLKAEGKEELYMVYPTEGVAISDSPLAYIDKKDDKTEKAFLELQKYLLSNSAQLAIQKTGKRSPDGSVDPSNKDVFSKSYGTDLDKVLTQTRFPSSEVILSALSMYQTEFKKPALTLYVTDYSGSMLGKGKSQMLTALKEVMIKQNAQRNLLQGTPKDKTYAILFDDTIIAEYEADGNADELERMYDKLSNTPTRGGTDVYIALEEALKILNHPSTKMHLDDYSTSIIVLSDGETNGNYNRFKDIYESSNLDVPIFSIMYGSAHKDELQELADLSGGRIFDGRENLTKAFQEVKGYN